MSWPFAIIVIVAIIALSEVLKAKHRAQHGITKDWLGSEVPPDHPSRRTPEINAELQREVEQLRERVQVLERIATDEARPRSLASEIESLRDRDED